MLLHLNCKCKQMSTAKLIKNVKIVNEGKVLEQEILIKNERIEKIASQISFKECEIIDGGGLFLIPGCIDDQVHFREPGFPHKANIETESRAAVAGGVTSFMDMPNTVPNTLTRKLLEDKYAIAAQSSSANYSFYMGTSNDNLEEILKIDNKKVCGIKIFMGSSTGNMLVDNEKVLNDVFAQSESLIAVHCEDETTIRNNMLDYESEFGVKLNALHHPLIRSREACLKSSQFAIQLARKHNTRLHILHISTKEEVGLFEANIPIHQKRITSEACVHHLYFTDEDYKKLGNTIKCNPAIKSKADRDAIRNALASGHIDVIATDHAPHTREEKSKNYREAPSGLPLIQQSLQLALTIGKESGWSLPFIVDKMSHSVAECFRIQERGYIREGYFADLVLLDPEDDHTVKNDGLLYKCGWSPLETYKLKGRIASTFINGNLIFKDNVFIDSKKGQRLEFK